MSELHFLVVEDNDDLRATITEMLEEVGHQVVACADAETALTLWPTRDFDALFTDISLPGISGTELTRLLLAEDPLHWVVWCSGYEYGEEVERFGPHVRVLPKAFEFEELEALTTEIHRSRRHTDAA